MNIGPLVLIKYHVLLFCSSFFVLTLGRLSMATVITSRSDSVTEHLSPVTLGRNLWHHRDLIRQFIRRDIEGRYKGSFLGMFWSFVNPLVLLLIYTFVF